MPLVRAVYHDLLRRVPARSTQGRNDEGKGHNFPGAESLWGRLMIAGRQKIPTMSQVHSSIQYICFRKISGSNMGAPNLHLAPGAI